VYVILCIVRVKTEQGMDKFKRSFFAVEERIREEKGVLALEFIHRSGELRFCLCMGKRLKFESKCFCIVRVRE